MQHPAGGAVLRFRFPTVYPGEHDRCGGPIAAFLQAGVPGFLQELAHLLVHRVQILVDVVAPHIEIRQLDRDVQAIVEPQPIDYVLVWLWLIVSAYGVEQLARIQHHRSPFGYRDNCTKKEKPRLER